MTAASLPLAALAAFAQETAPAPQIAAPAGKTAVRASDSIRVSGAATGLPDGDVTAELVGYGADGALFRERLPEGDVTVSGGQFVGDVVLSCGFGEPGPARCADVNPSVEDVHRVALKIAGATRSNTLRVDYTDPEILGYELIDATSVRVRFSEPVRAPEGDNPVDFDIDHDGSTDTPAVFPVQVADPKDASCSYPEAAMTTGCTRILTLAQPFRQTEDATPFVQYLPNLLSNQSQAYTDYADNSLAIKIEQERSNAVDRIRPAAPTISTIDGKTPTGSEFTSTNPAPVARITNLRVVPAEDAEKAHTLELRVQRDGGTVRKSTVPIAPESNAADVTLPLLAADAGYTVTAVAIDAAGNRSDDDSLRAPAERADGARSTARYVLDREAPEVLAAGLTDSLTVGVQLTEPVAPDGDAGQWYVGDIPVTASGSGDVRTLKAQVSLANPGTLRWEPTSAEAGSTGAYGDKAGNAMLALDGLPLQDLPPLTAPRVTAPTDNVFTRGDQVTIRGGADDRQDLVAELFTQGGSTVVTSVPVNDGRWSITQALSEDGRYEYEVRIRDTKTGVLSQRARVADIIRDTAAPVIDVTRPDPTPALPLDGPAEYAVGDAVTVEWTATDAADDPKRPDHGRSARVVLVSSTGTQRAVSGVLEHQPGQKQTFTYRPTEQDLDGQGSVDLQFRVVVDDLARNVGDDLSGTISLIGNRVGYTPVLTELAGSGNVSVIDAKFPAALTGSMFPGDWTVDGEVAGAQLVEDGRVVRLTIPLADDPNATPRIKYAPSAPAEQQLQTESGRLVIKKERLTRDRVIPALGDITVTPSRKVVDARTVEFRGTTDVSARRNTIAAYKVSSSGGRDGAAIAKGVAATDGTWKLDVPLVPNRHNRIVIQAVDPSGNRSALSDPPRVIEEDSIAPVVRLLSPRRAGLTAQVLRIRWSTVEENKSFARLQYRPRNGEWQSISPSTADDGFYKWALPDSLNDRTFELRVRSYDRVGKRDSAAVQGLRGDFERPVLYRARTLSANKVRLYFNERMDMTREGWTVAGIGVEKVLKDGDRQTLILRRNLDRTTPQVVYDGNRARDLVGNRLADRKLTAERGFVFSVTNLDADRLSRSTVRLEWRDARNRATHIKHYRVYRDGNRIGTVSWDRRSFKDTDGAGSNRYVVRAVDINGRVSSAKAVTTR